MGLLTEPAPAPRPTSSLGGLALALSVGALGCVAFHFGPLISLAFSVYALIMARTRPERYGGAAMAGWGIAISLMAGIFVVTMRPYFNSRGELRYGAVMDRMNGASLEANAVGALRMISSVEYQYAQEHGGAIATIDCLRAPTQCTPALPAGTPPFLTEWPGATVEGNWTVTFHAAPAVPASSGIAPSSRALQ